MHDSKPVRLAVIGAGPGGYAAAFMAADLGLDVTMIDPAPNPGGVCLYRGCIPTKALLHLAAIIHESRETERMGVTFKPPVIDIERVRSWKMSVVKRLTDGLGTLTRQRKVQYIQGKASFKDSRTLTVQVLDSTGEMEFDRIILATGSRSATIPGINIPTKRVWTSDEALNLPFVPESLLVIGGGYIGMELATIYEALGSRVNVVEMMPQIMPGIDRDLVSVYERKAAALFGSIMVNTRVASVREGPENVSVNLEGGSEKEITVQAVLVSIGRKPNTERLGLENTKVSLDRGFIQVDARCQTADPGIFAIGDITGQPMLAHKASHQGRVAAEVIAGREASFDPRSIPAVVFTDPEIAVCGLSETEARDKKIDIAVSRFPWAASGRAVALERTDGVTKLVCDNKSGRILGMGIVGVHAGELISEGALAIEMEALASDMSRTIHPHPTLSETLMEAAEAFYGESTHVIRRK